MGFVAKFLRALNMKRRASVGGMPIMLLTFAVVSIIGVFIFSQIYAALPTLTGTANTTVVAFAANYYSGVVLLGVALIVLAAVAIIKIVGMLSNAA